MGTAATGALNWSVALRLGRVSNLPTVWTNVLAGLVLAGQPALSLATPVLLIAMSFFYVGGMFLNDAFDRDIDRRERPERPIPAGDISVQAVFVTGFAQLALGLLCLVWVGYDSGWSLWRAPLSGLALAGAIVLYNWRHKNNPLSPLVMGACRTLVYLTAGFAVSAALPAELLAAAGVALAYLIGLTYVAKQETLGRVRNLWPLAFLAVPLLYGLSMAGGGALGFLLWAGFLGWVLWALSLLRAPHRNVPRTVVSLIAGISLMDALFIAGQGEPVLAVAAVGAFLLTLRLQRHVSGT